MKARKQRKREDAIAVAAAFHEPKRIDEMYPRPAPRKAWKWWG